MDLQTQIDYTANGYVYIINHMSRTFTIKSFEAKIGEQIIATDIAGQRIKTGNKVEIPLEFPELILIEENASLASKELRNCIYRLRLRKKYDSFFQEKRLNVI